MNGSGKTMLVKLLCRLYDPFKETILLNGTDIREYIYEEYMQQFSVVFQDFKLLALPLGENVGAALDPISEHEIYSGFRRLIGEKPRFSYHTAFLPAAFAMTFWFSMKECSFSGERMRNW